jgi:hypothetical protein
MTAHSSSFPFRSQSAELSNHDSMISVPDSLWVDDVTDHKTFLRLLPFSAAENRYNDNEECDPVAVGKRQMPVGWLMVWIYIQKAEAYKYLK